MLCIKSAQYMREVPPKVLPEEQLDPRYEITKCKLCQKPAYVDDLKGNDGFCQDCLDSGDLDNCKGCKEIKLASDLNDGFCPKCLYGTVECSQCQKRILEDDGSPTQDGIICADCYQDLYQDDRYVGPRREYYSGPAEEY